MIGRIFQVKKESICLNIYYLRNLHISDTTTTNKPLKGNDPLYIRNIILILISLKIILIS